MEAFAVQTARRLPGQGVPHQLPGLCPPGGIHVPQQQVGVVLQNGVVAGKAQVLAEASVQNRLFEGRLVGTGEDGGEGGESGGFLRLVIAAVDPALGKQGLILQALLRSNLIIQGFLPGDRRLRGDFRVRVNAVEGGQNSLQFCQGRLHIHAAVQEEAGVGGVIIAGVAGLVVFKGQLRNVGGVAAGVEAVGSVREELALHVFQEHAVGVGVVPLHLVEHHAVDAELPVGLFQLVVPALLSEGLGIPDTQGVEDGVQIHVHEIQKILVVPAGQGIHGLVREGEGIQEGGEGAF